VHFFARTLGDYDEDLDKVAEHFRWPLLKAESAHAYAEAYAEEIVEDDHTYDIRSQFEALRTVLPSIEKTVVRKP